MKLPRPRSRVLLLAAALAVVSCSEPEGLDVTVTMGDFTGLARLRVILTVEGGFAPQAGTKTRVTYESRDTDGDKVNEFVVEIPNPAKTETFRVTTGNKSALTFRGRAMVFDEEKLVADGRSEIPLTQGGHAELKIGVTEYKGTIVSPKLRTTDLSEKAADVTLAGTQGKAPIQALAVCDFDKDGNDDIAVGVPSAEPNAAIGPTGGVFITFGNGATANYEVGKGREFHFYSNESVAKLGTAVACADLNGDGFGDLIVGAPGATNGKDTPVGTGKVYVVYGRQDLDTTTIDFTGTKQPDITWTTSVANAALGSALFAASQEGVEPNKIPNKILASAPGASLVHLFANVVPSTTVIDADKPDHTTFAGVKAAALGAGRFTAKTGPYDVVLGDPELVPAGSLEKTGVVYVFRAVQTSPPMAYAVAGATTRIIGAEKSQFGAAVLALDTTATGQDLFVGAPGGAANVGQVHVYEHNDNFFGLTERPVATAKKVVAGFVTGDQFGRALAGTPSGTAPSVTWRLLVGAPGTARPGMRTLSGAAYLLGSDAAYSFPVLEELFGAASNDALGNVVAGGQIDPGDAGDLVALAPGAKGTVAGTGAVYVKLGQ